MEVILGEVTIRERRKKLEEMARGNGLSDAYTATLTRLKAQKGNRSDLGLRGLMWVSYSERPLRVEELCDALGVKIGSTNRDPESVPAIGTLLSSCLGLLTLEASTSTVRLVHFTLQEHLSSDPTLFHDPHPTIAEACLTYLNFGSVRDLAPTLHSAPSIMPLLTYASVYWGEHTRKGMTENVKMRALGLLDRFDEHIVAKLLLLECEESHYWGPGLNGRVQPRGFTGLHVVAYLGIVEVTAAVLEMKELDVNASDCSGITALTWAAYEGHEEVVKMLLEDKDINPDQGQTGSIETPLECAVMRGHEGIIKMLLEREGINLDPALWSAAREGNEELVKMLLKRKEVNPDWTDPQWGQTPLSRAAWHGHEQGSEWSAEDWTGLASQVESQV